MGSSGEHLLERADALRETDRLLDAAAAGHGGVLLLDGAAGVGKTSILEVARTRAERAGMRVLAARAGVFDAELAWNVVRQLLEPPARLQPDSALSGASALALRVLGASASAGSTSGPGSGDDIRPAESGLLHGLYWLTADQAETAPLLIVVDDAHWADEASLRYLLYLGERIGDLPVLLVLAMRRGEELAPPLRALVAFPGARRIALEELRQEASATLARAALGSDADPGFCQACHEATGGNPFLLHELIAQLRRDGIRPDAASTATVAAVTPDTVTRSTVLRLSLLGEEPRRLAQAVAIIGGGAELELAAQLARLDQEAAVAAGDALVEAELLRHDVALEFKHPLVAATVLSELAPLERDRSHRAAARLLFAADASPERVAAQLLQTHPAGDDWAAERLTAAARLASDSGSPRAAADLLARAAREPPSERLRLDVLVALARAQMACGDAAALAGFEAALPICDEPEGRAGILLELGRARYVAGLPVAACEAFEEGLTELSRCRPSADEALAAQLRAGWLGAARLDIGLRGRAAELASAVAADPPPGASYGERALLAMAANELMFVCEPREAAVELAGRALAGGDLVDQETSDGPMWTIAAGVLAWADDFDSWDGAIARAIDDARRRGSIVGFATASYAFSFSNYYRGRLVEAIADAGQAIATRHMGWSQFLLAAYAQQAWALIERDELAAAERALRDARADPSWEGSVMQMIVLEAEARLALAQGRPRDALELVSQCRPLAEAARLINPSVIPWRSTAVIAAGRAGRLAEARVYADEDLELARRFGAPRAIGMALGAAGVIRGKTGVDLLAEAVETLEQSPARLEWVRAQVRLGAALRRHRSRADALTVLRAGFDHAIELGATRIERHAHAELTAAGASAARRPRRADPLTAAEHRVATMAAAGASNREIAEGLFVSLRTIETHLTHTYAKLGIQRRAELAAALERS